MMLDIWLSIAVLFWLGVTFWFYINEMDKDIKRSKQAKREAIRQGQRRMIEMYKGTPAHKCNCKECECEEKFFSCEDGFRSNSYSKEFIDMHNDIWGGK